jgi:hypothetical protein
MYFRRYVFFLAAGLVFALSGCSQFSGDPVRPFSHSAFGDSPESPDFRDRTGDGSFPPEERENDPFAQIRVPMGPEDIILRVLNANLDIDQLEEQIILFKKKNDPGDKIRILVADFDNVRNSYVAAWQAETQGINNRSVSLELIDLLGDHVPEILCFGRNNNGEQTLDVFRKTLPPQGFGIYYTRIASLFSGGSIEVEERTRSEAYRLLQRNDESFSLAVYEKDPVSSNINDLIRASWFWNHQDSAYKLGKTEKIAGQIIAEKQLAELFSKGVEDFESFLSGPWYRTESGEIIHFDVKERRIIFFNGGMEEIFLWQSSYRTIYRGLYLNCTNESISNITKQLSISVSGMDSFELAIKNEEGWDGQYRRLGKDLQASYLSAGQKQVRLASVHLSGLYKSETGMEIYFSSPRFTLRENGKEVSGAYVVYAFDGDILELKIIKDNGLVDSLQTYRVTFQEDRQGKQILRNLLLQPAEIRSDRVEVKARGDIRLQQITDADY